MPQRVLAIHLRRRLDLSQVELAARADTSRQTVVRFERGDRVSFSTYARLAFGLDVSMLALAGVDIVARGRNDLVEVYDEILKALRPAFEAVGGLDLLPDAALTKLVMGVEPSDTATRLAELMKLVVEAAQNDEAPGTTPGLANNKAVRQDRRRAPV